MQSKSETTNRIDPVPQNIPQTTAYSEPWWRSIEYNPVSKAAAGVNVSIATSLERPNGGSQPNDGHSMSNDDLNEDYDDAKDSQTTGSPHSGTCNRQENQIGLHVTSSEPMRHGEFIRQSSELELVSHSIACASNPYQDPCFGGMMPAYGHQHFNYLPFMGMPHRMPLPPEMTQEPVFVNAKQYQGILRRRQARAKAEIEKKVIKVRKPYLHESRHQHAMRRARGTGGRFAKKNEADEGNSGPALSSQSAISSRSELMPSNSNGIWNSSNGQEKLRLAQNHSGFQALAHKLRERGDDGDCSGQQWVSISTSQTSQRCLAIQ